MTQYPIISIVVGIAILAFAFYLIYKQKHNPKTDRSKKRSQIQLPEDRLERLQWYKNNLRKFTLESLENVNSKVFSSEFTVDCGTYISGNSFINSKEALEVIAYAVDGKILLFRRQSIGYKAIQYWQIGEIPIESIHSITLEDESTIEKRITLGRILAVGIFALAWKKKKTTAIAIVVIGWKDGKFEQEDIFQFTGVNAMNMANHAKIKLQKLSQ